MDALPREIRAARSFLHQQGYKANKVSPRQFAGAAKELGVGFRRLLLLLGRVLDKGQDEASERQRYLENQEVKLQPEMKDERRRKRP